MYKEIEKTTTRYVDVQLINDDYFHTISLFIHQNYANTQLTVINSIMFYLQGSHLKNSKRRPFPPTPSTLLPPLSPTPTPFSHRQHLYPMSIYLIFLLLLLFLLPYLLLPPNPSPILCHPPTKNVVIIIIIITQQQRERAREGESSNSNIKKKNDRERRRVEEREGRKGGRGALHSCAT